MNYIYFKEGNMDIEKSVRKRVKIIQELLDETGAKGIVYGNSGGKDSALVSILCKLATENVLGVIMPCGTFLENDNRDAIELGEIFEIEQKRVDLTEVRELLLEKINDTVSEESKRNIAPRLRMTTLYAIAQSKGYLVAGTTNRSEALVGYFTKWGDSGCDFNPISDITSDEVYAHLKYFANLKPIPVGIQTKAPSAGLYEGQTDEQDLGVSYNAINGYIKGDLISEKDKEKIERYKRLTAHKKRMPFKFLD